MSLSFQATREAEIRRIMGLDYPGQKNLWDSISMEKKLDMVCHPSDSGKQASMVNKWDPISKITIAKRAGGMVQVIKYLPCKSLKPSSKTWI
jgi:hypothetical protein